MKKSGTWRTASGTLALVSAVAGYIPQPAIAQDSGPASDILVTAGKRSEAVADIPLSVTAFDRERLDRLVVHSIADVVALVPGFTLARSFRGPPIYTLRGIGFNSPNLSAAAPVGIYMDEISYPYPVMSEGLAFDLDRVEVLKGPQGTLFGRNTTGGLVNSIAVKPHQESDGYAQLSSGSYESYGLQAALGGGLTRTLSARLAFDVQRSDKGWQKSVSHGGRLGKVDKAAARLALLWEPIETTQILLTANWSRDGSDTQAAQAVEYYPYSFVAQGLTPDQWPATVAALGLPANTLTQSFTPTKASQANWTVTQLPWGGTVGGRNFTPAPLRFRRDNDMRSIALRADIDLAAGIRLTSLTGYARFVRNEATDVGGWDIENGIVRGRGRIETFSQELRLSGETKELDWVAGLAFAADHVIDRDQNWVGTSTAVQPLRIIGAQLAAAAGADLAAQEDILFGFRNFENSTKQDIRSYAAFGQAQWRFAPAFNLTLGLRYTLDRARFSGCARDMGDNSIAATWNAFFNGSGIPSSVAAGGCVTYGAGLGPAILSGGALPFPGQGVVRDRLEQDNLSGRIALAWDVRPDTMLYASATRGFKAGAFPNIEANVAEQYTPARQEEVRAFELGAKARPSERLSINVAAYYSDYRNKQVFGGVEDIIFGQLNRIVNMPRSHIYGGEIDMALTLLPGLSAQGSAAYTRTQIDQYVALNDLGIRRDFAGDRFSYAPRFQAYGSLTQRFAMRSGIQGSAMLSARYASRQQADLEGATRFATKSYVVMDATLTIATGDQANVLTVFVKNLADRYYVSSVHLQFDSVVKYAAMPRTWGVAIKRVF
jgi:outer membrane receptor protein involved in Fe transport